MNAGYPNEWETSPSALRVTKPVPSRESFESDQRRLHVSVAGVLAGITVPFTLFGLFHEVLLLKLLPLYCHYNLLVAVGFNLYYGVGSYLGMERVEEMVRKGLASTK